MITVKEIIPMKLSGLSSFLVFSDRLTPELVDLLSSYPAYYHHKKLGA